MPKGVMMFEDPPVHTMLRGLMSRVFTPRRMAEIEDQIRRFCVNCLDPHVGSDGFDIVAELASMMPMRVIGMLLGFRSPTRSPCATPTTPTCAPSPVRR